MRTIIPLPPSVCALPCILHSSLMGHLHRHHRLGHMAGHNWQPETLRVAVLFDFSCSNLDEARADPPQENMWRDCTPGTSQPLRLLRKTCRALTIRLWLLRTGTPAVQDAPLGGYSDAFAAQQRLPAEVVHRARVAGAPATLASSKI